jgi:hypothetical protein
MKLYSCRVAHPAVTHSGFSVLHALRKVNRLEIHKREGDVALVQVDDHQDELTQSSHDSVEDAMHSARVDFGVETEEWERAS